MLKKHINNIEDEYYEEFLEFIATSKPVLSCVYFSKSLHRKQPLLLSVSRKKDIMNCSITKIEKFVVTAA